MFHKLFKTFKSTLMLAAILALLVGIAWDVRPVAASSASLACNGNNAVVSWSGMSPNWSVDISGSGPGLPTHGASDATGSGSKTLAGPGTWTGVVVKDGAPASAGSITCSGGSGGGGDTPITPETKPWYEGSDTGGDYRMDPNPAEDFAVYCRNGYIEVWRTQPTPPTFYARFPISWAVNASGSPTDLSIYVSPFTTDPSGLSITRTDDNVTLSDDAGRQKTFSLAECVQKAGLGPGQPPAVPCDMAALAAAEALVAKLEDERQHVAANKEEVAWRMLNNAFNVLFRVTISHGLTLEEVARHDPDPFALSLGGPSSPLPPAVVMAQRKHREAEIRLFEARAELGRIENQLASAQATLDALREACDQLPEGTVFETYADGTVQATTPDGTVVTTTPDRSMVTSRPDGTMGATFSSGAQNVPVPPGSQFTFDPENRTGELIVGKGGMDLPGQGLKPWPQGTVVTLGEKGKLTIKYPDGSVDEGLIIPSVDRVFRQLEEWTVTQQERAAGGG